MLAAGRAEVAPDLSWMVPQVVLGGVGQRPERAVGTATDAADQESRVGWVEGRNPAHASSSLSVLASWPADASHPS